MFLCRIDYDKFKNNLNHGHLKNFWTVAVRERRKDKGRWRKLWWDRGSWRTSGKGRALQRSLEVPRSNRDIQPCPEAHHLNRQKDGHRLQTHRHLPQTRKQPQNQRKYRRVLQITWERRRLGKKEQAQSLWRHLPPHRQGFHCSKQTLRWCATHLQLPRSDELLKIGHLQRADWNSQHGQSQHQEENTWLFWSYRLSDEASRYQWLHSIFLLLQVPQLLPSVCKNNWFGQERPLPPPPHSLFHQGNQSHHILTIPWILQNRQAWVHG